MQAREDLTNVQFPILNSHPKGEAVACVRAVEHFAIRHPLRMRIAHWELSIGQIPGRIQGSGWRIPDSRSGIGNAPWYQVQSDGFPLPTSSFCGPMARRDTNFRELPKLRCRNGRHDARQPREHARRDRFVHGLSGLLVRQVRKPAIISCLDAQADEIHR